MASTSAPAEAELLRRVEALSDSFEPAAVAEYVRLFSQVIADRTGLWSASELEQRYERIRQASRLERPDETVRTVVVLSRITLGADIAVTSVLLDAARRRFPGARILLAGPRANWELFAGEPRIRWLPAEYGRTSSLDQRLAAGLALRERLRDLEGLVLDPDSRLTQLGLLPVCEDRRYRFFESRTYGGAGEAPLGLLASWWSEEVLGVSGAAPWIAPGAECQETPAITVSLGVGENPAKRLDEEFEAGLLAGLASFGLPLLVDTGAGGEEAQRVRRAAERVRRPGCEVRLFRGSFASFAACIARSRLYVGYDSAGQHAAAALGVPTVTVFAGFPCERFFARWRPWGPGPRRTVRVDSGADPRAVLREALDAAAELLGRWA
ncbi:MAG: glycosyltransferase family 9 protein [Bryobacterales bacterium]|nr:glycosyltransferase family 9 protein [Bryobacterales bacterium]